MVKVFISYRSIERDEVQKLADAIEKLGHDVWFDKKLTGGHIWWEQILEQIRNADVIVFALSPAAIVSEPCKRERQYALDLGKNLIPVQIKDGINFKLLPSSIGQRQVVNYVNPDVNAALDLANAFNSLPEPQPLPVHLPAPPPVPLPAFAEIQDELEQSSIPLNRQEAIISRLQRMLQKNDDYDDAMTLIHRLRDHRDVKISVAKEIDALLEKQQVSTFVTPAPERTKSRPTPQKKSIPETKNSRKVTPKVRKVKKTTPESTVNILIPDFEVIGISLVLGVTYFGLLFQGYALRWLYYRRGLIDKDANITDFFYGTTFTFRLAKLIAKQSQWSYLLISLFGWTASIFIGALAVPYFAGGEFTNSTLYVVYTGLVTGLIGGYVSSFVLRMAQNDALRSK